MSTAQAIPATSLVLQVPALDPCHPVLSPRASRSFNLTPVICKEWVWVWELLRHHPQHLVHL